MNKEKLGRDRIENGKKSKSVNDTIKPIIVKEYQSNVNYSYLYFNLIILKF